MYVYAHMHLCLCVLICGWVPHARQPHKQTKNYNPSNNQQMEIDRVKFILARYLSARLRKIEKRVLHIALSPEILQR